MMSRIACSLACLFLVAGCSETPASPDTGSVPNDTGMPGIDAGVDAATPTPDTGVDAASVTPDTGVDAAPGSDAGGGPDAGSDAGTSTGCGTAMPTLPTAGTEGLVIAHDGTIYYSVNGGVARMTSDGTVTANWLRIPGSGTIWGLALDATNTHMFVCDVNRGQIRVATNLTTTPTETMLASVTQPNGITVGPDGAVYVSSFSMNRVVRVDATSGTTTTVTTSSIAGADGVAFADDGRLLVTSYSNGTVVALTLDGTTHAETARATVATMVPSADGVALDENGVIYVGGGRSVWRIGTGGTPDMTLQMMGPMGTANIEWGAGALNCHDLYVATGSGLRRIPLTVGQRAVPWH